MSEPMSCICGHPADVHEHLRPGSDCGPCGDALCPEFVPTGHRLPVSPALRRVLGVGGLTAGTLAVLGVAVYAGDLAVAATLALVGGVAVWLLVSPKEDR